MNDVWCQSTHSESVESTPDFEEGGPIKRKREEKRKERVEEEEREKERERDGKTMTTPIPASIPHFLI
jgi:hypothetical protein